MLEPSSATAGLSSTLVSVQTTLPRPSSSLPFTIHPFPALAAVETFPEVFVCIILFVIHKVFAKLFFISVPLFVCRNILSSPSECLNRWCFVSLIPGLKTALVP